MSSEGLQAPPQQVENDTPPAVEQAGHNHEAGHEHNGNCCGAEVMYNTTEADIFSSDLLVGTETPATELSGNSQERQSIGSCEDGSCGHMHHHEADTMADELFSSLENSTSTTATQESSHNNSAEQQATDNTGENTFSSSTESFSGGSATIETAELSSASQEQATDIAQETTTATEVAAANTENATSPEITADTSTEATNSDREAADTAAAVSGGSESYASQATSESESTTAQAEKTTEAETTRQETVDTNSTADAEPEPTEATAPAENVTTIQPEAPIESQPKVVATETESEPRQVMQSEKSEEKVQPVSSEVKDTLVADIEGADETESENIQTTEIKANAASEDVAEADYDKMPPLEELEIPEVASESLDVEAATEASPVVEMPPLLEEEQSITSTETDNETAETSSIEHHNAQDIEAIFAEAEAITQANETNNTAPQAETEMATQQTRADATPEEAFDIDQIMANIEKLHAEEELPDTTTEPLTTEQLTGSEFQPIDTPTQLETQDSQSSDETVVEPTHIPETNQPMENVAETISAEINQLKTGTDVSIDTLSPLLEKHELTLSDYQLEELLALLTSGNSEQVTEYITGLLKLRRNEYRQEFLSTSQQDFTKQLTQKHQRLVVMLRKFLPKLVPISANN